MADKQGEVQNIAQMTMKKIGCDPKDAIRQEKSVFMCRILGEAASIKTKEGRSGEPYSYLIGEFRGINSTGGVYESSKLFLPVALLEQIEGALTASEGKAVQFGFDIFAAPDDNSVGYRYAAKSLVKAEAADRLAELAKQLDVKPLPKTEKPVEKEKK